MWRRGFSRSRSLVYLVQRAVELEVICGQRCKVTHMGRYSSHIDSQKREGVVT